MSYTHPAWVEHQRRRWLRNDAHLWVRHDAHRFAPPGEVQAKSYAARRIEQRRAQEEQAARVEELKAFYAEHLQVRRQLADLKFDLALRRIFRKYSPDQPRVPAGSSDGGQWTGGAGSSAVDDGSDTSQDTGSLAQDRASQLAPGPGQEPRRDLLDLDAIANHPSIRARIDEAWAASDPNGFGREQGFWISRNDATGELFTRPFANPGGPATIVPGAMPSDAIASFHTHPARPDFGGDPGPSLEDLRYAARTGVPGLLQSHSGMYYFGPLLRPRRSP